MKTLEEFELQAYLDGELSDGEARGVEQRLEQDPEARRLVAELTWTRGLLMSHEPEMALPESREFYWGKIEKAIAAQEEDHAWGAGISWLQSLLGWRRFLAPAAGLALVFMLVLTVVKFYHWTEPNQIPHYMAQVENPSEEMGSFSFRSQAENVFVVWLYDRPLESRVNMALVNDMVIQ